MLKRDYKRPRTERVSIMLCANVGLVMVMLCLFPTSGLSQEECAGLTYEGMCTGNLVQWCEEGEVIQIDCTDLGMVCGWDEEKGYSCLSGDTMDICDLPPEGICASETVVQWCSAGELETLECKHGMVCGWNNNHMYYDCVPEDGYGSTDNHSKNDEANPQGRNESASEHGENRSDDGLSAENSGAPDATEANSDPSKYDDEEFSETDVSAPPEVLGQVETQRSQKEDMGLPSQSADDPILGGCQQQHQNQPVGFILLFFILVTGSLSQRYFFRS